MDRFLDHTFPLVTIVPPAVYDEQAVRSVIEGCERNFARGERFAMITTAPQGVPDARTRKVLTEWSNAPAVRRKTKELCVGAATVLPNPVARGIMTAVLWVWSPPAPHEVSDSDASAIDWCLRKIADAKLPMPMSPGEARSRTLALIAELR